EPLRFARRLLRNVDDLANQPVGDRRIFLGRGGRLVRRRRPRGGGRRSRGQGKRNRLLRGNRQQLRRGKQRLESRRQFAPGRQGPRLLERPGDAGAIQGQ